jgi:hypothetical protein
LSFFWSSSPANALLALPSKAAPGASRAAPILRLRRNDRLARRRGCGNSRLRFDDSALSRSLVVVGLISDFIEWVSIGLVLVKLLGKTCLTFSLTHSARFYSRNLGTYTHSKCRRRATSKIYVSPLTGARVRLALLHWPAAMRLPVALLVVLSLH